MFDMHQGFSGEELREASPTVTSLAMTQLEVPAALVRGRFKLAARQQVEAWKLLGRLAAQTVRERLGKPTKK